MFRNVTLKCLTEIAGVSVSQYEEQFVSLFTLTMMQLKQVTHLSLLVCGNTNIWICPSYLLPHTHVPIFDLIVVFFFPSLFVFKMLPLNTNIRLAYSNGKDDEQNFIQNLSLFLCTFLKEHGQLIEKRLNLRETLMEVVKKICQWNRTHNHPQISHTMVKLISCLFFC